MGNLRKAGKRYKNNERWDNPFKNDMFSYPEGRPTKVRLWEDIYTIPMHYVKFKNKDGEGKGFYALCLAWDYDNECHADHECPYCDCDINRTEYSYGALFKRSEQRRGNLQIKVVRMTPKLAGDLAKLTDYAYPDEEWPEGYEEDEPGAGPLATDRKYGFDVMLSVERSGKKTEYPCAVAPKGTVPLKKEEIAAFKEFMEQFDFLALAKAALPSAAQAKKDLQRIGLLGASKDSSDPDDFDVPDDDDDDDDAGLGRGKRGKKRGKKPATKKVTSLDDEEDEDDDDLDDAPSKSYASSDGESEPDDDDDDDEFDEFDDD